MCEAFNTAFCRNGIQLVICKHGLHMKYQAFYNVRVSPSYCVKIKRCRRLESTTCTCILTDLKKRNTLIAAFFMSLKDGKTIILVVC